MDLKNKIFINVLIKCNINTVCLYTVLLSLRNQLIVIILSHFEKWEKARPRHAVFNVFLKFQLGQIKGNHHGKSMTFGKQLYYHWHMQFPWRLFCPAPEFSY